MELTEQAQIVDRIRGKLEDYTGTRLKVKANMGRSRIIECEGVLTQAHPQLFIMEVEKKRGRVMRQSYQYVDILTGVVELSSIEDNESLFPLSF
ncbi:MAG: Veg family protein [Coriobacteriia bacterium]|nr:Veg family protein [Coriobacteriia bacterium]